MSNTLTANATTDQTLNGWKIAVPESRQLDVLTNMLAVRGADVTRCPLVSIHNSPNEDGIKTWLTTFCDNHYDDLIILTGEGIRRLTSVAEKFNMLDDWKQALANVRKIARGPKPASALRPLGTKPDLLAAAPTTSGVIETLETLDLTNRKVAVQLYGEEPNLPLQDYLKQQQANYTVVAPYIYASDAETQQVEQFIHQLLGHTLDVMVFTSVVQIKRLKSVAKKMGCENALWEALNTMCIASVGPVISTMLDEHNVHVDVMPDEKFFMKPMVRKLVKYIEQHPKP